jgi:hypothetical protein
MALHAQLRPWYFKPQERAAAKAAGETTYFTGRPCKFGHVVGRVTSSGTCVECAKTNQRRSYKKRIAANPNWVKDQYAKNPEYHRQRRKEYRLKNPEKERLISLASMQKRKPQKAADERARQARKLKATPLWLTKEQLGEMKNVYVAAQKTSDLAGFKCHVDHIIPLKGKDVCGLHVPWNLRIVSQSYNSRKSNSIDDGAIFKPSLMGGFLVHSSALPWNWSK